MTRGGKRVVVASHTDEEDAGNVVVAEIVGVPDALLDHDVVHSLCRVQQSGEKLHVATARYSVDVFLEN